MRNMMTPIHNAWSVWPWSRFDEPEPANDYGNQGTATLPNGVIADLVPRNPEGWEDQHRRNGVRIHDHDRKVTYYATVDQRGKLDHLVVEVNGFIDENALRRVPVRRIEQVAHNRALELRKAREEATDGKEPFLVGLPGHLTEPAKPGGVPSAEEIAELMTTRGMGRQQLARHYQRPVRTIDGWIRRARKEAPDLMPASRKSTAKHNPLTNQEKNQ